MTIALNKDEEKMILAKREKEKAEEKAKAAQKKIDDLKKVERMEKNASDFVAKEAAKTNKILDYMSKFNEKCPGHYELVKTKRSEKFTAYNYIPLNSRSGVINNANYIPGEEREVLAEKTVSYFDYKIVLKANEDYYITFRNHTTYPRHSSFRGVNKGLKMKMNFPRYDAPDRLYTNPKKVHEKIQDHIEAAKTKVVAKIKAKGDAARTIEMLKEKYPEAVEVTAERIFKLYSYQSRRGRREGYHKNVAEVTFANGVKVNYTYDNVNGEIKITYSSSTRGNINPDVMIEALKNLPAENTDQ